MRIAFLAGGSAIHTIRLVNAMVEKGHEVHLLTMQPQGYDKINDEVIIHKLRIKPPLGYYLNYIEVKKILLRLQPDILNAHYASGYGTLSRLVGYSPTLLSVWGSDAYGFPYKKRINQKILKKNLNAADQIASTSWDMKLQVEKFVQPQKEIALTPFGINLNEFKLIPNVKKKEFITIGTVKKLEEIYGTRYILEAVSGLIDKLKNNNFEFLANKIRVLMVGEGSQMEEMKELSVKLGIDTITSFVGKVPHNEVPQYLNKLDIYCAPSLRESFGVAVLEASACEIPVIVSDVDGLPEVVIDNKTGYIVKAKDSKDITDKLYELILNEQKRMLFGKNGREFVKDNYEWNSNVSRIEKLYNNLLDTNI